MNYTRIKICHIANVITGKTDGIFTHIKSLVKNLDNIKYEHILIYQGGGIVKDFANEYNFQTFEVPDFSKTFSFKAIKSIIDIAKQNNVDIIHTHAVKSYLYAGLSNFVLNKKLIFNYQGLFIKNNYYYSRFVKILMYSVHFIIALFKKVNIAVAPSKQSKKLLYDETSFFPSIEHYYNGIELINDNEMNNPKLNSDVNNNLLTIGIVARLEYQKRLDRALLMIKELSKLKDNFKVIIYGDGPLEYELQLLANNLGIDRLVEFKGYTADILKKYKDFDILLYTSDWEGLPLSLFESMINSIPVVSTDVGGIKEILIENNCGLVYSKDNLQEGIECLLKLMQNRQLRIIYGKNAVEAVRNKYSIKNFASTFDKIYSNLFYE
jgi:glycosyltransferase involved in cell wall biosynthesis